MILNDKFTEQQFNDSFDYIEQFISNNVQTWDSAPNTADIVSSFNLSIKEMDDNNFALLVLHSGYIPELYPQDSSQETLYSKLIESLVCEWAIRIGFSNSYLQTQKSNKEDVTLVFENKYIVCDAKSFRLGRSQAAPNVKDTIKKQAYTTWLENYKDKDPIGGLVTFPSLHDWKRGSEAYLYFTQGNPSIIMLFYEHLAFMLLFNITASDLISALESYPTIFENPNDNRDDYWNKIYNSLFNKHIDEFNEFQEEIKDIINKKVNYTILKLSDFLSEKYKDIKNNVESLPFKDVQEFAIKAQYQNLCKDFERQKDNITKFRTKK